MRNCLLAALLMAALPSPGTAAPCVPGTLAEYVGLGSGGCTVGGALFSDFMSGAAPGALALDDDDITVAPLQGPTSVGLSFGLSATAGSGEILGNAIGYQIGGVRLLSRTLALDAPGSTHGVATEVVPDGAFTAVQFAPDPLIVFDIGSDAELAASAALPRTRSLSVLTEITLDGGLAGSASIHGSLAQQYAVPEPASASLAGLALGAVAWRLRRRARA
jgi:hypothetical protein